MTKPRTAARSSWRSNSRTRLLVFVLLGSAAPSLAGCSELSPSTDNLSSDGVGVVHVVEVVARDDVFDPVALDVPVGRHVTVEVTNAGDRPHSLVVHRPRLSTGTLQPGERASVTVTAGNDPVIYYCSVHRGMTGQVRPMMTAAGPLRPCPACGVGARAGRAG